MSTLPKASTKTRRKQTLKFEPRTPQLKRNLTPDTDSRDLESDEEYLRLMIELDLIGASFNSYEATITNSVF